MKLCGPLRFYPAQFATNRATFAFAHKATCEILCADWKPYALTQSIKDYLR